LTEVITSPSAETRHEADGDVRTGGLGDHARAAARRRADALARVRFDPTRGRESNAAVLFDPTRGRESNAAVLFDPTRGSEIVAAHLFDPTRGSDIGTSYLFDPTRGREIDASPLQLDLARWARTTGLTAVSS